MKCASVGLSSLFLVAGSALAGDIEQIAPRNSVLIFSVDDATATGTHLKEGGFGRFWEQALGAMQAELPPEAAAEADDMAAGMMPQGHIGFALFPINTPEGPAVPGALLLAEFGENIESGWAMLEATLDQGVAEGAIEAAHHELRGRDVLEINVIMPEMPDLGAPAGEDPAMADPFGAEMMMPDVESMMSGFESFYIVRDADAIWISTSLEVIDEAIEHDGEKNFNSIGQRREFSGLRDQLGPADAYTVFFPQNMYALFGEQGMMLSMMIQPMLGQFVGDVRGVGYAMRLDAPDAMLEQTLALHLPNGRRGLSALMDVAGPRGDVPLFVPADALSYSKLNFEFDGVVDMVRPFMQMAAAMAGGQPGEEPAELIMLEEFMSTLGSEIHTWRTMIETEEGPFLGGVRAINCADPEGFEAGLVAFGADLGLEKTELDEGVLYTMTEDLGALMPQMPGMPGMPEVPGGDAAPVMPDLTSPGGPVAIAITGEQILIGDATSVERALSGGPSLNINSTLIGAMQTLPDEPVTAWGFSDTATVSIAQLEAQRAMVGDMVEQVEMPPGADQLPIDQILELMQFFGPTAWQITVDQNGFVYRSKTLPGAGLE